MIHYDRQNNALMGLLTQAGFAKAADITSSVFANIPEQYVKCRREESVA